MPLKRRSFFYIPLLVLICAILGGIYGPKVQIASAATSDDETKANLQQFTKVYDTVEQNFADPVSPDKAIYKGAIPGMLRTLDPHSNFFDPKDLEDSARRPARTLLWRRHVGAGPKRQNHRYGAVRRLAGVQSRIAAWRHHHRW